MYSVYVVSLVSISMRNIQGIIYTSIVLYIHCPILYSTLSLPVPNDIDSILFQHYCIWIYPIVYYFGTQGLYSFFSTHLLLPFPTVELLIVPCRRPPSERYSPLCEVVTPRPSG